MNPLDNLVHALCTTLNADHHAVTTGNRKQPHLHHRQTITLYLWQEGHTFTDIAHALNQHHTTIMHTVYTHWDDQTLQTAADQLASQHTKQTR